LDLAEYRRKEKLELGTKATQFVRIYLDTKYWVMATNFALGRSVTDAERQLVARLYEAVNQGKAICPVSEEAVMEALAHTDPLVRHRTGQVMDELSREFAVESHKQRIRIECEHFIRAALLGHDSIGPLVRYAWTNPCHVLGEFHPVLLDLDEQEQNALQLRFHQHRSSFGVADVLRELPGLPPITPERRKYHEDRLTTGKTAHAQHLRTFEDALKAELDGALDVHRKDLIGSIRTVVDDRESAEAVLSKAIAPKLRRMLDRGELRLAGS
jgi:hypothetical protein